LTVVRVNEDAKMNDDGCFLAKGVDALHISSKLQSLTNFAFQVPQ
jgi:hypothetical protein